MSEVPDTVEALVSEHRPMAERLARRYSHGASVDPDLHQVADIGLFLAATRYDPDAGPFRPFAMATIVGELKKHLRANGWVVRVPRRLQESSIAVSAAAEHLEQIMKRSPTPGEIADETGLTTESVLQALYAKNARFGAEHSGVGPAVDDQLADVDLAIDVRVAAAQLSAESRRLLGLRFEEELSQREIARRLDISQSQVHRRLASVLRELRETFANSGQDDE